MPELPANPPHAQPETFAAPRQAPCEGSACHAPSERACSLINCKADEDLLEVGPECEQPFASGPFLSETGRQSVSSSIPSAPSWESLSAPIPPEGACLPCVVSAFSDGPELESYDEFDLAPSVQRADEDSGVVVQLETRGATPQFAQVNFWRSQTIHKESILCKLRSINRQDLCQSVEKCHTQESILYCTGCRKKKTVFNRCEVKWCPECQARLSRERRETVEWWTKEIHQPKHVVLTCRNTERFTRDQVRAFKASFVRLRRTKFASNWEGGFYSLEVTNEGKGWHLHLHALVNARFIDSKILAQTWAKIVGQDFAIVCVKDARSKSYLNEVTKYAVKGSQLASWTGSDIAEFIDALDGIKTFGVFGELYSKRQLFREWIDQLQSGTQECECGCAHLIFLSPDEMAERELNHDVFAPSVVARPPPKEHPEFNIFSNFHAVAALSR